VIRAPIIYESNTDSTYDLQLPPQTIIETITSISTLPASTILSTLTQSGTTSTITSTLPASTTTSLIFSTVTLPGSVVTSTVSGSPITLTQQIPASTIISTILVTQILTITQVVPSTIIQTTILTPAPSPQPSVSCGSPCQVEFTASRLEYPGDVIIETVSVPTVTLDYLLDEAGRTSRTSLYTVPLATTTSAVTWQYSGVALTWPTVYAAYATFSHFIVSPVGGGCTTSTLSLTLPSPTNFAPLILPTSLIPNPDIVASQVVDYLNTQPTIIAQLGRSIGAGACDPLLTTPRPTSTKSLGVQTSVASVAQVGATTTRIVPAAVVQPSQAPQPDPPAPSPPAPSSNTPVPTSSPAPQPSSAAPAASSTPLPPQPSSSASAASSTPLPPQPSSSAPAAFSTPLPPPPPSSAPPASSLTDSASQVPPPPSPSPPPPPSPIITRGTTTSANGTVSPPRLSSSPPVFTGAAALQTGKIVGWLVGAAGLGMGLI
jgi:hypothetical protein